MMKTKPISIFFLILSFFLFTACESNLSGQASDLASGTSNESNTDNSDNSDDSSDDAVVTTGTVIGKITDASDGANLADVTVTLSSGETATTDSVGEFSITGVTQGSITATLSKTGYTSQTISLTVVAEEDVSASASLLTSTFGNNKIAIILSWGSTADGAPADLDAALHVPVTDSSTTTISYLQPGNISANPNAALDVDDRNGDGPETITINYSGSSLPYARTYRYYVHNYSNGAGSAPETFAVSSAVVRVYVNGVLQNTFNVDTSNSNHYWHVFDIESDGSITTQNQYSNSVPATLY